MKYWLFTLLIFYGTLSFAQKREIDSLQHLLTALSAQPKFEADTNYLITINELAKAYQNINPDTTFILANRSLALCEKVRYDKGIVEAIINIGMSYSVKGDEKNALLHYQKGLKIAEKIKYKKGESTLYNSIADVYNKQGKYPKALENYLKSMRIGEEIGSKKSISTSLNNIAIIYANQGKDSLALAYCLKALEIRKALNDKHNIGKTLQGMAILYYNADNYEKSLAHNLQSLKIREEIDDKQGVAFSAASVSNVYARLHDKEKVIFYLNKAETAYQHLKDTYSRAWILQSIGTTYKDMQKYEKAIVYAKEALKMSQEANYLELIMYNGEILSQSYESINEPKEALYYYKLFKTFADSVNNIAVEGKIAEISTKHEYDKKEAILKAEYEKQSKQQKWVIFSVTSSLLLVCIFAALLWRNRKQLQKANLELNLQKQKINAWNLDLERKVSERTQTIELANKKLQQYSFSNSHHLRRPVSTILGLVALFKMQDANDPSNLTILEMLLKSTEELDNIIHNINDNLQMPDENNGEVS